MESTRQSIVIAQVIGNYQVLAQLGSGGMKFTAPTVMPTPKMIPASGEG
jgi:hypothetical protein